MSNNLKRKAQRHPRNEIFHSIVGLSRVLGCESMKEVELTLMLMGYEVNQKRFDKLPPLDEMKKRVQLKKV